MKNENTNPATPNSQLTDLGTPNGEADQSVSSKAVIENPKKGVLGTGGERDITNEYAMSDEDAKEHLSSEEGGDEHPGFQEICLGVEAILFAASEPLSLAAIKRSVTEAYGEPVDGPIVRGALNRLLEAWADESRRAGRSFTLNESGGLFAFRSTLEVAPYMKSFLQAKPQRLSRALLETLSIVAYRQPITRAQVDSVRGVDCANALRQLVEKGLLRVLGRAEELGRPLIYGTTKVFLDFFGLKRLSDLPSLRDYEELHGLDTLRPKTPAEKSGRVRVVDLFEDRTDDDLISEDTQKESQEALAALEDALGLAVTMLKETEDARAKTESDNNEEPTANSAETTEDELQSSDLSDT